MAAEGHGASHRADARANHAALLDAAAALVGRRAVELPYDEIAVAAGVGRATVYRHFPTRDALARALIEAALDRWEAVVADLAGGPGCLEHIFDAWVQRQQNRSDSVDLLTRCAPEADLRRARRRFETTLQEPTRAARDAGLLCDGVGARDVRLVLEMLSAALRSTESSGDRRRAIRIARRSVFTAG